MPFRPPDAAGHDTGQLPDAASCEVCAAPLTAPLPHAPRVCGARACRRAWLGERPHERQRTLTLAIRARGEAWAASLGAGLVVTPANERVIEPALPARQQAFLDGLRGKVAAALAMDTVMPATMAQDRADPTIAHACATCRGFCCTRGGTHAFLDAASLQRASQLHGWRTDEEATDAYRAHLPSPAYQGSCVFHARMGCALPRTMRSETCNRHLCGGLAVLGRERTPAQGPLSSTTLVLAANWAIPVRAAVETGSNLRVVSLDVLPDGASQGL